MDLSASVFLFFPVIPAAVLGAMLMGMAVAALPLMWLAYWLLPPGWMRDLTPRTVFPACMLTVPIIVLGGIVGVALVSDAPEMAEYEKPTMAEVRERQALFRHLLPDRAIRATTTD